MYLPGGTNSHGSSSQSYINSVIPSASVTSAHIAGDGVDIKASVGQEESHDVPGNELEQSVELMQEEEQSTDDEVFTGKRNYMKSIKKKQLPQVCLYCGKEFAFASQVRRHLLSHEGSFTSPHVCPICNKALASKYILKIHIAEVHEGVKSFVCDVCGRMFSNNTGLKWHMITHTGAKNYSCDDCGSAFSRLTILKNHKFRAHGKAPKQPLTCEVCGMQFLQESRLRNHMAKHMKESHSCPHCDKVFAHKNNLTTHIKGIHEQNKNYECQYCSRRFGNSYNLKVHIRIHTGDKPYVCKLCNKGFADVCNFRRHEQKCDLAGTPIAHLADPVQERDIDGNMEGYALPVAASLVTANPPALVPSLPQVTDMMARMEKSDIMQMRALYASHLQNEMQANPYQ